MDSFELNKVLGAVLGTCLILLALNITAGAVFSVHNPEKPGYAVAVTEQPTGDKPAQAAPEVPIAKRLVSADTSRGEVSAKKCATCHTFDKGGRNLIGPNLWGIVGRPVATHEGFNYSTAMRNHKGEWTFEKLDDYLTHPQTTVPGTKMTFTGIPKANERADLLSFLNTKSDKPLPLPKADASATPAPQPAAAPAQQPAAAPAQQPAAPASPKPAAPAAQQPAAQPATPAAPKPH
jgi:cytochrome c